MESSSLVVALQKNAHPSPLYPPFAARSPRLKPPTNQIAFVSTFITVSFRINRHIVVIPPRVRPRRPRLRLRLRLGAHRVLDLLSRGPPALFKQPLLRAAPDHLPVLARDRHRDRVRVHARPAYRRFWVGVQNRSARGVEFLFAAVSVMAIRHHVR